VAKDEKKLSGVFKRIGRYFREVRVEIGKVSWPKRDDALRLTGIVLATTAGFALLLGFIDFGLSQLFGLFIR
jgi:preprotein translocase subunit SecE